MRNFLKYPSLEWRRREEYCIPSGPNFAWAQQIKLGIDGSQLHFKAPRHSPLRAPFGKAHHHPLYDVLRNPYTHGLLKYATGLMANDHWGYRTGLARRWAFWGPWMTGCKAELSFSLAVIGRQPGHEFSDVSLFHPKAFEMVLVQYLNDRYGHEDLESGGGSRETAYWHGPMDWQRHNHLPVFSASFKIFGRGSDLPGKTGVDRLNIGGNPHQHFVFPITDQHFVNVSFRQHLYSTDVNDTPLFDTTPIQALQDAIFNSITLQLSPEAQASYDKIKAENRNMQLSKTFAPLQWPTHLYQSASEPEPSGNAVFKLGSGS